jgi:hypothetical protein
VWDIFVSPVKYDRNCDIAVYRMADAAIHWDVDRHWICISSEWPETIHCFPLVEMFCKKCFSHCESLTPVTFESETNRSRSMYKEWFHIVLASQFNSFLVKFNLGWLSVSPIDFWPGPCEFGIFYRSGFEHGCDSILLFPLWVSSMCDCNNQL